MSRPWSVEADGGWWVVGQSSRVRRRSPVDRWFALPPATARRIAIHEDLAVPMRDGVVLRADRYAPDRDERAPVVLVRTPYGRKGCGGVCSAAPLAARGYQIASAAFPRFARNPGTGEPLALATRQLPAVQDVFHDPAHPTRLTLPVITAS